MAGDDEDGANEPYAPRQNARTGKNRKPGKPDLRVVANAMEGGGGNRRSAGKAGKEPAVDDVAAALKDADADSPLAEIGRDDPAPGGRIRGIRPGEWTPDEWGLPPDCPVLPLGTEDGVYHFLDTIGQLRSLKGSELGQAGINELFMGRHLYLTWAFPKSVRDVITSWRPERVREVLLAACARKGTWSPLNAVRGRGMWRGRDGRLIMHCGDRLVSSRGEEPLGELERRIYPTRPPIARPWPVSLAGKPGPMARLFPHFSTWRWARPLLDPVLLMGWIAVAYMGGAAPYRPAAYTLGGKGTGKSALHNDMKSLFDEWLINTGDTTSAGIYQLLKFDCLPVAADEFEAKADNRKLKGVIELMRLSFSGAPLNRGGDRGTGIQFHGRSAFQFSSINRPPFEPQDISRTAWLRLKKLPADAVKPIIAEEEMAELGRKVLRRIMDEWHRWPATFTAWREFLATCGHDGRGQDTYGMLMAAADLVIADDAEALGLALGPAATDGESPYESWRPLLETTALPEYQETAENHEQCLTHLLSTRIEAWRGGTRHTAGELLTEFWERDMADPQALSFDGARKMLQQAGLTLTHPRDNGTGHFELLVPFNNPELHRLFAGSKWAGELGSGSWTDALRQYPEDMWHEASGRINGQKAKGIAFALKDIIESDKEKGGLTV